MGLVNVAGLVGESVIDGLCEGSDLREATLGDLMRFDIVPDRFDRGLCGQYYAR